MTETQRARTARVSVKWHEVTDFETEVAVDPLREALLSWLKPDALHYDATVEKIETASAEELAEIAGDYIGAVTALIIEGETLSIEDCGSESELTEITVKPAPTSNLEPSHGGGDRMPIYQVTGRRINDRPDPDGWMSSGTDLPLANIDAPDVDTALDIGHQMAEKGDTPLTRTVVQAYRWVADGIEEYRDSTRWWLDGARVEPVRLIREYARNGHVLHRHPIASARIADEVRWVTGPLEHLWLQVQLTGPDQWAIAIADPQISLTKSDLRRRFSSPDHALYFAEQQAGVRVTEEQAPPEETAREADT